MINQNFVRGLVPAIALIFLLMSTANAASGDYDVSFGNGGSVAWEASVTYRYKLGLQQDGKLLVGWTTHFHLLPTLMLRRHNADGSVDTSFGSQGYAVQTQTPTTQFFSGSVEKVLALDDGRIAVVGSRGMAMRGGAYSYTATLWLFTASGALDTTFSAESIPSLSNEYSWGTDVEAAAGGKLYVAFTNSTDESILARINPDGSSDTTFGTSGTITRSGVARDIVVAPERSGGAIYWIGRVSGSMARIRRYLSSGALDSSYGFFGNASLAGTCFENTGGMNTSAFELTPDGKLIYGGKDNDGVHHIPFIARFTSNGALDTSFSSDGIAGCPVQFAQEPILKVQTDKKILLLRAPGLPTLAVLGFQRITESGEADLSFIPQAPPSETNTGTDMLIQPDGKIVTIALSSNPEGYRLSRYLP